MAVSDTNTAVAFDKSISEGERLRAIDRVALIDEILTYIINYKGEHND